MGILSRASYVIRSKLNALISSAEDPSEQLDYSYEQMRDELQNVKRGIADLTTQKKRLEIQKRRLEENVEKHNDQARQAVSQDREDLARKALEKKKQKMQQIEELEAQIVDLQNTQDNLVEKKDELQSQIERFRTEKETMKARYEAAEASAKVSEAMTGAGDEFDGLVDVAGGEAGKRFALPHSTIMVHQPHGGVGGQISDIEIQAKEILRHRQSLNEILAHHTGQPLEKIAKDIDRDFYLTAEGAKEYGVVDDILSKPTVDVGDDDD